MAEGFELPDQVALAGFGIVVPGEVLGAEVLVINVVGQQVPGDDQDAVPDGEHRAGLALLPERAHQMSVLGGQVAVLAAGRGPGRLGRVTAAVYATGGPRSAKRAHHATGKDHL